MNVSDKRRKEGKHIQGRLAVSVLLFVISGGLMILAARNPAFAEWYSGQIYPLLVESLGRVSGSVPFSVSEIVLYVLAAVFLVSFVILIKRLAVPPRGKTRFLFFSSWLSRVLLAAGILAFLYTVCCGINYHRKSFSEEEGIITYSYSAGDLQSVCMWLTEEVNALAPEVGRGDDQVMELTGPAKQGAVEAMYSLAGEYESLEGYYPPPKELLISEVLSYQGLTGIYLPFTIEANYNGDMTEYNIPFTACHELSHLRGFMQEQEANFIGFLACIHSERTDFRYSGYLSGWVYCMNALYRADYEKWEETRALLCREAEPDLAANSAFWDRYEGPVSETATRINDTYLKANGQADGVESYDRMVDLIVVYFGENVEAGS